MGRKLMRVPLDFDWPLDKKWAGYLSPFDFPKCEACDGEGHNRETLQISRDFYDFDGTGRRWSHKITQDEVEALAKAGRLMDWTHTWDPEKRWQKKDPPYTPTAEEVNAANAPGARGFGHDAINRWVLIETRAKRLGVWGKCRWCKGKGHFSTPKLEKMAEAWKAKEPPKGPGYQLWETTTEGSPQTPVFKTIEELCNYAAENCTTFGSSKASAEEWRSMLDKDFVCHRSGNAIFM